MERISVRRISPILHRERAGQAFPQEHGPAVGEPKQVGEHPKPGSIPLFWRDSKWKISYKKFIKCFVALTDIK